MAEAIGQTIPTGTYYSPWLAAQGNGAEMTVEYLGGGGALTVTVETKNSEDDDSSIGGTTWSSSAVSSAGVDTWKAGEPVGVTGTPGLLELVRFKYVVTTDVVHFRMLNPSWYSG